MAQVNPDTLIQIPTGQWISAVLAGPVVNGKVTVNDDTVIQVPGGTMQAGLVPSDATFTTQPVANDQTKTETKPAAGDQGSADVAAGLLHQYGLDELLPFVDRIARGSLTLSQLTAMLYDPTTDPGKVVDRLYPEIQLLRKAGKEPMSIPEIQQYKATARDVFHSAGVPPEVYASNGMLTKYIVGSVGLPELQERAAEYADYGARLQANADPEQLAALKGFEDFYQVRLTAGDVAAMALNADIALPVLKQRFKAVDANAAALQSGFGSLAKSEAEQIATLGVSGDQLRQGFSTLAGLGQITTPLVGQDQSLDTISRADQIGAAFEGDAAAQRRIEQNRQKVLSPFQSGGSFANSQEGFVGAGTARGR